MFDVIATVASHIKIIKGKTFFSFSTLDFSTLRYVAMKHGSFVHLINSIYTFQDASSITFRFINISTFTITQTWGALTDRTDCYTLVSEYWNSPCSKVSAGGAPWWRVSVPRCEVYVLKPSLSSLSVSESFGGGRFWVWCAPHGGWVEMNTRWTGNLWRVRRKWKSTAPMTCTMSMVTTRQSKAYPVFTTMDVAASNTGCKSSDILFSNTPDW